MGGASIMQLHENAISAEILGVFKISRRKYVNIKSTSRLYDTLSIRLLGVGEFKTASGNFSVRCGDLLYMPRNVEYQQSADDETIIAIHFNGFQLFYISFSIHCSYANYSSIPT